MKYLFLTLLFIQSSLACQLSIPESYIPTFLSPPVSGAYETCESKPEEKCHCVEKIDPWIAELIDETDDIGVYTGHKILQNSEVKKAALLAVKLDDEAKTKQLEVKKKAAMEALKSVDIEGATTVAKLKVIIKLLLEAK